MAQCQNNWQIILQCLGQKVSGWGHVRSSQSKCCKYTMERKESKTTGQKQIPLLLVYRSVKVTSGIITLLAFHWAMYIHAQFFSLNTCRRCRRAKVWQFLIVYSRCRSRRDDITGTWRRTDVLVADSDTTHAAIIRFMFSRPVFVLRIAYARIDHSRSRRSYSRVYYINNVAHLPRQNVSAPDDCRTSPAARRRRFSRIRPAQCQDL